MNAWLDAGPVQIGAVSVPCWAQISGNFDTSSLHPPQLRQLRVRPSLPNEQTLIDDRRHGEPSVPGSALQRLPQVAGPHDGPQLPLWPPQEVGHRRGHERGEETLVAGRVVFRERVHHQQAGRRQLRRSGDVRGDVRTNS